MLLGAFEATSGIWMMIRCFRHLGRFCSFAHPNFLVIDIAVLSSSPQKNIGGLSDFKPFKLKNHYLSHKKKLLLSIMFKNIGILKNNGLL